MGPTIFSVVYPGSEAFSKAMLNLYRFKNSILPHGPPRHLVPDVIERAAAGIHFLVTAEAVKEVVAFAGGSRVTRVAGDEAAEVGLGRHDLVDIVVFSQEHVRLVIKRVQRPAQVARIVQVATGERVITGRQVRTVGLAREKNAGAGMQPVMVSEAGIDHEIRPVVQLDGISRF